MSSDGFAERVDLRRRSPWWGEHRSRYHFAAKYARGRRVVDVACGTGFGSRIMVDAGAEAVLGIDLSWDALGDAVREAHQHFVACRGDGMQLPVKDGSVDVVASFETIEHVLDAGRFVAELRRVVRSSGVVLISTPNALRTKSSRGRPRNPFHVYEYDPNELRDLLSSNFRDVELLGQRSRDAYDIDPFWEASETLPTGISGNARLLSWRIQNRLPFGIKDRISRLLHNRGFYPGEYDWVFDPVQVETAHVIVARCRP